MLIKEKAAHMSIATHLFRLSSSVFGTVCTGHGVQAPAGTEYECFWLGGSQVVDSHPQSNILLRLNPRGNLVGARLGLEERDVWVRDGGVG